MQWCRWSDGRGQSSPIALVLVFGLVVGASTVVLLVGGLAINDTQGQLDVASAEKAMTKLDSQASLVALGQSRTQTVALGSTGSNNYQVTDSGGRMTVSYTNASDGDVTTLMDTDMGAINYEGEGGAQVVYQGGGVWRADGNGNTTMVSPPEFHYREGTLTLPLVTVSNDATISGDAVIKQEQTTRAYPNDALSNPLTGGTITITIESQYHEGWYRYLNSRTQGTVDHDPANQRVEMTLTVPIETEFENSVATVAEDGIVNETAFEEPYEEGVTAPVPDSRIDAKIDGCATGGCTELSSKVQKETLTAGTYNASESTTFQDVTYDTDGGDIDVIVNGDVNFKKSNDIIGSGNVTFYVKGDVTTQGKARVNTDGDPDDLLIMVHSAGDSVAASKGTPQLTALVYAPGSDFVISGGGSCGRSQSDENSIVAPDAAVIGSSATVGQPSRRPTGRTANTAGEPVTRDPDDNPGGGPSDNPGGGSSCEANVVGSIVADTADGGGNGDVNHAGSITRSLDFTTASAITYLHVSENRITVTD